MRNAVDFPHPLGPRIVRKRPRGIASDTGSIASTPARTQERTPRTLRAFGRADERPYRRRPTDVVRVVLAVVLLVASARHVGAAHPVERDLARVFGDLPSGLEGVFRSLLALGTLWGVVLVTVAALLLRRLRLALALAGAGVLAWGAAREAVGRRAAHVAAALVAVGPLFVWYSQEARVYALFAMLGALATFAFVRVLHERTGATALLAIAGALCLATHYFAFFLLAPMAVWILADGRLRRRAWPAVATFVLVGLALIPLLLAQGGHYTQWIGQWTLSERILAIAQYWLLGESGAPLGHGIELLVALPFLLGAVLWLARVARRPPAVEQRELEGALTMLVLCGTAILAPIALSIVGIDYLTPRNLIASMVPLTVLAGIVLGSRSTGLAGFVCALAAIAAMLLVTLDVSINHRLQRGDWRGLAAGITGDHSTRAITAVHLATTPLQYYLGPLQVLPAGSSVKVDEIAEAGYPPLVADPEVPPAPGFRFIGTVRAHGLLAYRFRAPAPLVVSESTLASHSIMAAKPGEAPEVLVSPTVEVIR